MHHEIGQSGESPQALWLIEVGEKRSGTLFAPEGALLAIAYQRQNAVMAEQMGQHAARHVTATNDQ
jgi:hypothetical protein